MTPGVMRTRAARAGRLLGAALLLGGTVALLVFQQDYRQLEAVVSSHVFGTRGVQTSVVPDAAVVIFRLADQRVFGLEISPVCSSAFLIAPFSALGAVMLWRPRLRPGRVGLGVTVVAVMLVACNQLRVGMIAGLIQVFGVRDGYRWGHLILGSLLSIVFLAGSLVLIVWIVASGRTARHPELA